MTTNLFTLYRGDCIETMRFWLPDNSVDAIVTDPPYGLGAEPDALAMLSDWITTGHHEVKSKRGFMGKEWDAFVPQPVVWRECMRVLKPGGYLLSFAGTRTHDLVTLGLRIAGFEIRDMIAWVYGSGFPKSLDVSKAIDKAAGAGREVVGVAKGAGMSAAVPSVGTFRDDAWVPKGPDLPITAPATDAARQWQGWGTALKPALEPITVARKPLAGTVAENVLAWGTGALNIDGARVPTDDNLNGGAYSNTGRQNEFFKNLDAGVGEFVQPAGRWPANLIHDGSEEVLALFPFTASGAPGIKRSSGADAGGNAGPALGSESRPAGTPMTGFGDAGSAARFFYCAKASKSDRDEGLDDMPDVHRPNGNKWTDQDYQVMKGERSEGREAGPRKNIHPTVKPTDLMRYLCRLVTPPGGVVLDPFMGSGSTGKAAMLEGLQFIGIEREAEYLEIARARISNQQQAA